MNHKLQQLLSLVLVLSLVIFISCGKDDDASLGPKITIDGVSNGGTLSLAGVGTLTVDISGADLSMLAVVVNNGVSDVVNETDAITGSSDQIVYDLSDGFPEGTYTVTLTATDNSDNTATFSFTLEFAWSENTAMYLRGTMNDWGTTSPMTLVALNTWEVTGISLTATNYEYKFSSNVTDWSDDDFGMGSGLSGTAQLAEGEGNNSTVTITNAGTYTFTFNDGDLSFSIEQEVF